MRQFKRFVGALFVAGALLLPSGCSTTSPTGEKVFDPIKTAQVQRAIEPTIASVVVIAVNSDVKARPAIALVGEVLDSLTASGVVNPQVVSDTLLSLDLKFLDNPQARQLAQVAVNSLVSIYNATLAQSFYTGVAQDKYALAILQTLSEGVKQGLAQTKGVQ